MLSEGSVSNLSDSSNFHNQFHFLYKIIKKDDKEKGLLIICSNMQLF